MKQSSRWWIGAVCASALMVIAPVQVNAQVKLATVDLKRVFEEFYMTQQADVQLRQEGVEAEKQLQSMMEDYKKANQEYSKLMESINDPVLSSDERDRRKGTAEKKLLDLKDVEQSITQFRDTTQRALDEKKRRLRETILRKIRESVTTKARAGSFTMVVDTAATSINQTPVVLYHDNQNDLTDAVLTELNANIPKSVLESIEKSKEAK